MNSSSHSPIPILIVEDEAAIRDMVRFALELEGFALLEAENTATAAKLLESEHPALILLDWMLPNQSGLQFAIQLKKNKDLGDIPIIFLTARAEESNKVKALEIGADDYIVKPFSPRELVARIRAVLRRASLVPEDGIIELGGIKLDHFRHQAFVNEEALSLRPIEYELLLFFMLHPDRVYSREQLLNKVWSEQIDVNERTVDVQIKRLREALKLSGLNESQGKVIQTVRSAGYIFVSKT